jgi:hypothetical protein
VRQRRQRQDAAFAVVVGAHDEDHVLQRHDDDEGPEDERERAEDGRLARHRAACRQHGFTHRIERTGAYVAEYDAKRCQREHRIVLARLRFGARWRSRYGFGWSKQITPQRLWCGCVGLVHGVRLELIRRNGRTKRSRAEAPSPQGRGP